MQLKWHLICQYYNGNFMCSCERGSRRRLSAYKHRVIDIVLLLKFEIEYCPLYWLTITPFSDFLHSVTIRSRALISCMLLDVSQSYNFVSYRDIPSLLVPEIIKFKNSKFWGNKEEEEKRRKEEEEEKRRKEAEEEKRRRREEGGAMAAASEPQASRSAEAGNTINEILGSGSLDSASATEALLSCIGGEL